MIVKNSLEKRVMDLLASGQSYSQIAGAIGKTKNAVAGIVSRCRVRNGYQPKYRGANNR